jgi:hypothetical protein
LPPDRAQGGVAGVTPEANDFWASAAPARMVVASLLIDAFREQLIELGLVGVVVEVVMHSSARVCMVSSTLLCVPSRQHEGIQRRLVHGARTRIADTTPGSR